MNGLAALHAQERRLQILVVLNAEPAYMASDNLLQSALDLYGLTATQDQIRGDLVWLEEQSLISIERRPHLFVAKLTARGMDTASGRCQVPGVARPRPE